MSKSLQELLHHCLKTDNWRLQLIQQWPSILGPLTSKVFIETIIDSTLILGVTDSCLMQELYLLSPLILNTIQKSLGNGFIKQVRFKKTEIYSHRILKKHINMKPVLKKITLTNAEQHALNSIKDAELQHALHTFYMRCRQEYDV